MLKELNAYFAPAVLAAQYDEVYSNKLPYLLENFFPNRKQSTNSLKMVKGHGGLPVSLMPSSYDAQPTFRDRPGVTYSETVLPFFREGYSLLGSDMVDIVALNDALKAGNEARVRELIARVYDDYNHLLDGAAVVRERMRAQLLFPEDGRPGIHFHANATNYVYDYDKDGTWHQNNYTVLSGTSKWDDATNSDPIETIVNVKEYINGEYGVELTRMVGRTKTFAKLAKNKNLISRINQYTASYMQPALVADVIKANADVDIFKHDKQYKDEAGTSKFFVPEGYVALLPSESVGETVFGITPEEANVALGKFAGESEVAIVDSGVAITHINQAMPPKDDLVAAQTVLPSFEGMDYCALIKVY